MLKLKRAGIQPGREVILMASGDGVRVTAGDSMDAIRQNFPVRLQRIYSYLLAAGISQLPERDHVIRQRYLGRGARA
jgi:hypothetical protein